MKKASFFLLILVLCALTALLCACGVSPTGVSVLTEPENLYITQGMAPDFTGGQISVTYSDGSTKTVDMADLDLSGIDNALVGDQTAVLTYTEGKKTFSVTLKMKVIAPTISSLELDLSAVKTDYIEGERFSAEGMKVTAHYVNDTTEEISPSACTVTPAVLSLGTKSVRITYRKKYQDVPVTVKEKSLTSIRVDVLPEKKEYYVGDYFDPFGLKVSACYDNGASEEIAIGELRFEREDETDYAAPISTDDTSVRIVYETEGHTFYTTMTVGQVLPLTVTSLAFESEQDTVLCYEGAEFPFEALADVRIVYVNGMEEVVSPTKLRFSLSDVTSTGQETVDLYLTECPDVTLSVPVDVREDAVLHIAVLVMPEKTEYNVGDVPDLTGISVEVTYAGGGKTVVGAEDVLTDTVLTENTTEIVVKYGGAETAYTVTVYETSVLLETIYEAKSSLLKKEYHVNEAVDLSGIVLGLHFSDGSEVDNYVPTAQNVKIKLVVEEAYVESGVILAGTSAVFLEVTYTDEADQEYVGEFLYEIALS